MSKRLGATIGCKDKTSSWHLNGFFPDESVCRLDVNQSLSQPTKYIPLTVHKAPELTKLQAASYVGVRYTWTLELARDTELR